MGPRPVTSGLSYQLFNGDFDNNNLLLNYGAGEAYEDRGQTGYGFQNDITFNSVEWLGAHTIKTGVKFKSVELSVASQTPYNPIFGIDINDPTETPWRVRFGAPIPGIDDLAIVSKNRQYGIYLQDDWDLTDQLQVNIGIRYDYEETPSYEEYVTPDYLLNAIFSQATNTASTEFNHPAAPPNTTYAQVLARGGINVADYISTGNNREPFDSAIAPRLGFSYDVTGEQRHVIFGGAGRSYDRNVFEYLARESSKGTYPTYSFSFNSALHDCVLGPQCVDWDPAYYDPNNLRALVAGDPRLGSQVFMLDNSIRTPYSDQFSLGMRNRVVIGNQDWVTSATVAYVKSEDGIVFLLGNRWGDSTFREPGTIWDGQPWGDRGQGIPGIGQFLIGTNGIETRSTQLLLSAEKPYTPESGWAATIAYTLTDASENRSAVADQGETYMFDFATLDEFGWHRSTAVPKHRLVATGIFDAPWETTISSKLTLATPQAFQGVNCLNAPSSKYCFPDPAIDDGTLGFKQFDLALQKQFSFMENAAVRLRLDILNVFNWANADARNDYRGGPGGNPNPDYLNINSYLQPTRTFKLSFSASWR